MPRPRGNIADCSVPLVISGAQVSIGLPGRVGRVS